MLGECRNSIRSSTLARHIEAINGSRIVVSAAEPAGWVEARRPGAPELRGIALESGTARPVRLLVASFGGTTQAVPVSRSDATAEQAIAMSAMGVGVGALDSDEPAPSGIADPDGLVLSASRKELWLFGGLAGGAPASDAWLLDIASARWTRFPLRAGGRVGEVLAATYSPDSDSVYALHREGAALRLSALQRGALAFEPVLSLPNPWKSFDDYWLRPGDQGGLVLAATRSGSARVARITPTGAATWRVLPHGMVGRPLVTPSGVAFVPSGGANSDPLLEHVPFAQFKPIPSGWQPTP